MLADLPPGDLKRFAARGLKRRARRLGNGMSRHAAVLWLLGTAGAAAGGWYAATTAGLF